MARLGTNQLDLLAGMTGVRSALVVPNKLTDSLCKRGLMTPGGTKTDGFLVVTPAGYRAIAAALESGAIPRPPIEQWFGKAKAGPP